MAAIMAVEPDQALLDQKFQGLEIRDLCQALRPFFQFAKPWQVTRSRYFAGRRPIQVFQKDLGLLEASPDATAFEMGLTIGRGNCNSYYARRVLEISPYHPRALSALMADDFESVKDRLPKLSGWAGKDPTLLRGIIQHHLANDQPDEAEPLLEKYLQRAPDFWGFTSLAEIYCARHDEHRWLATYERLFREMPEHGLQHASAAAEVAWNLMRDNRYGEALPYARRAAASYSEWGLRAWACCEAGLDHWKELNEAMEAADRRYDHMNWYSFCQFYGHGDLQAARQIAAAKVNSLEANPTVDALRSIGFFGLLEGDRAKAFAAFEQIETRRDRSTRDADPYDQMQLALLADPASQADLRDQALAQAGNFHACEQRQVPVCLLAEEFAAHLKRGTHAGFDDKLVVAAILAAAPDERPRLNFYVALFCEQYTAPDQAQRFWQRCLTAYPRKFFVQAVASQRLRMAGIDSLSVARQAHWLNWPAGKVDRLSIDVRVEGRCRLELRPQGIGAVAVDGGPVEMWIDGAEQKLRWGGVDSREHRRLVASFIDLDLGAPRFDLTELLVSDTRNGSRSPRANRVDVATHEDWRAVNIEDQDPGRGWYHVALRRRPAAVPPPQKSVVTVSDTRVKGRYARDVRDCFAAREFSSMEFPFVLTTVGSKTTLTVWLSRKGDARYSGELAIYVADHISTVFHWDAEEPFPQAQSLDEARKVVLDVSPYVKQPGRYSLLIQEKTNTAHNTPGSLDAWRFQVDTQ
jgi:tetratricopeptide (TPR) repeat protein